eukprot:COSAG01_NODE_8161_length_2895_cov_34.890558_4_plen_279_part_00
MTLRASMSGALRSKPARAGGANTRVAAALAQKRFCASAAGGPSRTGEQRLMPATTASRSCQRTVSRGVATQQPQQPGPPQTHIVLRSGESQTRTVERERDGAWCEVALSPSITGQGGSRRLVGHAVKAQAAAVEAPSPERLRHHQFLHPQFLQRGGWRRTSSFRQFFMAERAHAQRLRAAAPPPPPSPSNVKRTIRRFPFEAGMTAKPPRSSSHRSHAIDAAAVSEAVAAVAVEAESPAFPFEPTVVGAPAPAPAGIDADSKQALWMPLEARRASASS